MEKPLKISLKIISPVHIGCDDVYEPTGFIINESKKKLVVFDTLDFIKSLSDTDRKQFAELCMQGDVASIPKLYYFIGNKKIEGKEIDIASGLPANYQKVKALSKSNDEKRIKQELNQFAIKRTAYNPHNDLPYIPGSSLKGSLRTAYLNMLADQTGTTGWKGKAKDLELKLMNGAFDTDPFRFVKVSDFLPVGAVKTKIMYAVNKKKITSKFEARGPYQIFEVIQPGAVFEGTISILEPSPKAGIKKAVTKNELFPAIRDFYGSAFTHECKLMKGIGVNCNLYEEVKEQYKGIFNTAAFVIRAGRHSGSEAVTIEGSRQIKIMQGKGKPPKFQDSSNTVWLASEQSKTNSNAGLLPLGWMLLSTSPLQGALDESRALKSQPPPEPPKPPADPASSVMGRIDALQHQNIAGQAEAVVTEIEKLEQPESRAKAARHFLSKIGSDKKKFKGKEWFQKLHDLAGSE
ncbi:MAG: type III-A CRISPR-associated RAMP protein Csm5 [Deltaproteobacteria bacterium]|nr:type III-A CRISPR-associated RAMP protein Csm5 [Deltaproteobacteria bacterium]